MTLTRPPEREWLSLARKVSPFLALILFLIIGAAAGAVVIGWVEVRRPQAPAPPVTRQSVEAFFGDRHQQPSTRNGTWMTRSGDVMAGWPTRCFRGTMAVNELA